MKKLSIISIGVSALLVSLMMGPAIAQNDYDTPTINESSVKKCEVPAGALGMYGREGHNITRQFYFADPMQITVLEELKDEEYTNSKTKIVTKFTLYRFSAEYDEPTFVCPVHGKDTWKVVKREIPPELYDYFWVSDLDNVVCE